MKKMKVGVVGCGVISDIYLSNAAKFKGYDVISVSDINNDRAVAQAEKYGIEKVYSYDDMVADPEVEIIMNLTVHAAHTPLCMKALEAGKHIYNEKPLGATFEEAKQIIALAKEKGLYVNNSNISACSELVNSLAILCGAATDKTAQQICNILAAPNDLTDISLSMFCFKYDALLLVDEKKYAPCVISSIERVYEKMLSAGATSFWEDVDGADAFDKAGSLCHGWSAMPVYYLHRLKKYL